MNTNNFNIISNEIELQLEKIRKINNDFKIKNKELNLKGNNLLSSYSNIPKYSVFNIDSVKTRINFNIQVLYKAAFFNLLYRNKSNVYKVKCKKTDGYPDLFEVNAELILNSVDFKLSNQFEMIYWNFFNLPEKTEELADCKVNDNNKDLFNIMDYLRRTR